jgi:hypothetical protein
MELVAKESSDAGHPMSDKMQVTTIVFSSLPLSWEKVVSTFSLLNLKSPLLSTKYPSSYASTNLSPSLGHQAYLTIPQIHYFIWPTILQYLKSTISCGLLSYNIYLKSTISYGLLSRWSPSHTLQAYYDTDWVGCPNDRKSIGGFCGFLGPNLIFWSFHKRRAISRFSTESEYCTLNETSRTNKHIHPFLLPDLQNSKQAELTAKHDKSTKILIC